MLLSETTTINWNSKIKKHYVDRGYVFTKMRDPFEVRVVDLTEGSGAPVNIRCDYCGKIYTVKWEVYRRMKNRTLRKDCCNDCLQIKAKEAVTYKYGGFTGMHDAYDDKRKKTNLERYGAENVFGGEEIKKKIAQTNIDKYGFAIPTQSKEIQKKIEKTCLEKYGVKSYVHTLKGKYIKENSSQWKGGPKTERTERRTYEYDQWRRSVYGRDLYTCQKCGDKSYKGHHVKLCAHHIFNWKDYPDVRYDINNGITLCEACHNAFHSKYGKRLNTDKQIVEFLEKG